jgi:carbamoyltransferase
MNKILGINYSGFHDTSISLVSQDGTIEGAISLERLSREKQDGRLPNLLLNNINFDEVSDIAISTNKYFEKNKKSSLLHPQKLKNIRDLNFTHQKEFYDFIDTLPDKQIHFIDHELSHASSAFWLSGFDEAVCLVYDGGMYNTNIFGGLYKCSKKDGIELIDGFDINQYAKITTLYSVITAILGFTPNKHEGKITGLAAFGQYDKKCIEILTDLFINNYDELESTLEWLFSYSDEVTPIFFKHTTKLDSIKKRFKNISKEVIAYNLQYITEEHILNILKSANEQNWLHKNICLAGGLFANVKVNQKISEFDIFKFDNIFIAPPMGDDGTAIGAAFEVVNTKYNITSINQNMFLGAKYSSDNILSVIKDLNINYSILENPEKDIAQILFNNEEVALFSNKMEFGPRSLGNRSILAPANNAQINTTINNKLHRTEFMPFAPMTLEEDLVNSYINIDNKKLAMKNMTISCECTQWMKENMPAVVHIDNTARPQIITKDNKFIHTMMTKYQELSGLSSIVNTSFNIHEEPIINNPYEAIKGFLISGLSYLYFQDANILISYEQNKNTALEFVKDRLVENKSKDIKNNKIIEYFDSKINSLSIELKEKEILLQDYSLPLIEKEKVIQNLLHENNKYRKNILIKILNKLGLIK